MHKKLSQMILDHKFRGILDQGAGCLVVFDEAVKDVRLLAWCIGLKCGLFQEMYPQALGTIKNMDEVATLVGGLMLTDALRRW